MQGKRGPANHMELRPQKKSRLVDSDSDTSEGSSHQDVLPVRVLNGLVSAEETPNGEREHISRNIRDNVMFDCIERHFNSMIEDQVPIGTMFARLFKPPCLVCLTPIDLRDPIVYRGILRVPYDVAHRRSVAHNGSNSPDNLIILCPPCNKTIGVEHVFEYIIRNYGPGTPQLDRLDRWFDDQTDRYRRLVNETTEAERKLCDLRGRGVITKSSFDRLMEALKSPINKRRVLIKAIMEWR